jgi:hypothetical protein
MFVKRLQTLYIQVNSKLYFLLKFCSSIVPTLFSINETSMFLINVSLKFRKVWGLVGFTFMV